MSDTLGTVASPCPFRTTLSVSLWFRFRSWAVGLAASCLSLMTTSCVTDERAYLKERATQAELTSIFCPTTIPLECADSIYQYLNQYHEIGRYVLRKRSAYLELHPRIAPAPVHAVQRIFIELAADGKDEALEHAVSFQMKGVTIESNPCAQSGCLNIFRQRRAASPTGTFAERQANNFNFYAPSQLDAFIRAYPDYVSNLEVEKKVSISLTASHSTTIPLFGRSAGVYAAIHRTNGGEVRECIVPTRLKSKSAIELEAAVFWVAVCVHGTSDSPCSIRCVDLDFDGRVLNNFRVSLRNKGARWVNASP